MSSGDKSKSSVSAASQQNPAHSSLTSSLQSAFTSDDKTEHKEPGSKSSRRFNYTSSGRHYQVLYIIRCAGKLFTDRFVVIVRACVIYLLLFCFSSSELSTQTVLINYSSMCSLTVSCKQLIYL